MYDDALSAALAYHARGWTLIPIRMADKRPLRRWKTYQTVRASEQQLRAWFAQGDHGVGVLFGAASGGLASRDFDSMEGYERWATAHPTLAVTLPTVATRRGRHVYTAASPQNIADARRRLGKPIQAEGAIDLSDGELRAGVGCYSVLPPSVHPSGVAYRWKVRLPDGPLPKVDLVAAGFTAIWSSSDREDTEDREDSDHREDRRITESTDAIATGPLASQADCSALLAVTEESIAWAIQAALPDGPGKRHRHVFKLVRALKAIPGLRDAKVKDLKPIVRRWHQEALTVIATKSFEETWADFVIGWPKARVPLGEETVKRAFLRACKSPSPTVARDYDDQVLRLLVALCRELQCVWGDEPFFLSCRTAGELLHIDHRVAARWLKVLVADEILEEVAKGAPNTKKASRYRYLAQLREV